MSDRKPLDSMVRIMIVASLGAVLLCSSGCVRRKVSITSTPTEALVWVNSQEVGRTPLVFEFTYDGVYDVRLMHEGCEALSTSASTDPPVWDLPGIDFFAEILPVEFTREVAWPFELEPSAPDPNARLEAARELRASVESATPSWSASNLEFESAPGPSETPGSAPIGSPSLPAEASSEPTGVEPPGLYPLGGGSELDD